MQKNISMGFMQVSIKYFCLYVRCLLLRSLLANTGRILMKLFCNMAVQETYKVDVIKASRCVRAQARDCGRDGL